MSNHCGFSDAHTPLLSSFSPSPYSFLSCGGGAKKKEMFVLTEGFYDYSPPTTPQRSTRFLREYL